MFLSFSSGMSGCQAYQCAATLLKKQDLITALQEQDQSSY